MACLLRRARRRMNIYGCIRPRRVNCSARLPWPSVPHSCAKRRISCSPTPNGIFTFWTSEFDQSVDFGKFLAPSCTYVTGTPTQKTRYLQHLAVASVHVAIDEAGGNTEPHGRFLLPAVPSWLTRSKPRSNRHKTKKICATSNSLLMEWPVRNNSGNPGMGSKM